MILKNKDRDPNKVSVIMTNYNCEDYIEKAINSVLNQTHKNLELMIIDDNSTDNSLDIIKKLANKDPRIRVFKNIENKGTYWSKNSIIHKTTGSFITNLDSDDYDLPHKLETQVKAINKKKGAMMATCLYNRLKPGSTTDIMKTALGWASMMFRYEVFETLGHYDTVKFGGDSEFYDRLILHYGNNCVARINEVLQIATSREDGLTGVFPERSALRKDYARLYQKWHKDTNDYYMAFPTNNRPFAINKKAIVEYADLSNSVVERTKSTKTLPVIMCVWKRVDGFIKTIEQLNQQTLKNFKLFVWNNNPDLEEEFLEALKLANFKYEIHTSHDNIGGFGRFYYAKRIRRSEGLLDYCVFIDDDQTFQKDTLSILLREARPNNITSQWGWQFTGYDYYGNSARIQRKPGESLHYAGTGGMVADMRLFDSEGLYKCPKQYWFVEDLWMSFYANHYLNYSLTKSACKVVNGDDEHSLYKTVFDVKKKMLKDLIDNYKWNIHVNFSESEVKPIETVTPKTLNKIKEDINIPKVSVVMQSYLRPYPGARSNAVYKFHRAVQSFIEQSYENTELIIVSDGCDLTEHEYNRKYKDVDNIKFIMSQKTDKLWPGSQRQKGVDAATGDWIMYLDTDDILHPRHISNIIEHADKDIKVIFNKLKTTAVDLIIHGDLRGWILVNGFKTHGSRLQQHLDKIGYGNLDTIHIMDKVYKYKSEEMKYTKFATWSIAHKKDVDAFWKDRNRRGEDIIFSNELMSSKYKIIESPTYIICHVPNSLDV